jgi:hypothetical protein
MLDGISPELRHRRTGSSLESVCQASRKQRTLEEIVQRATTTAPTRAEILTLVPELRDEEYLKAADVARRELKSAEPQVPDAYRRTFGLRVGVCSCCA